MEFSYNVYSPSDDEEKLSKVSELVSGAQLYDLIMDIIEKKNEQCLTFDNVNAIDNKRYCFNARYTNDEEEGKQYLNLVCDIFVPPEKNIIMFSTDEDQIQQYLKDIELPLSNSQKENIKTCCENFIDKKLPPDFSTWIDSTHFSFFSTYGPTEEKLFRLAFSNYRKKKPEIFKAFSFKHLSDVTQYYVHPNNQSYKGKTTLSQALGEAISLFQMIYNAKTKKGKPLADGNIYVSTFDGKSCEGKEEVG